MHAAHGFAAHKRYELPAYNAGLTNEGKPANSRNNERCRCRLAIGVIQRKTHSMPPY